MASSFRALTEEELGFVGGGNTITVRGWRPSRSEYDSWFEGGGSETGDPRTEAGNSGDGDPPPPVEEMLCDNETAPESDPSVDPTQKQAFEEYLAELAEQLNTIDPDTVFSGQVNIAGEIFDIEFSAGEFLAILKGYEFVFANSMTSASGLGGSFDDFAVVDPALLTLINSPTIQGQVLNTDIADWLVVHEVGHQLRAVEALTNGLFQQWYSANSADLTGLSQEQITEIWRTTDAFADLESMNNSVGRAILGESGSSSFWGSPGKGYSTSLTLTVSIQPGAGEAGERQANECGGGEGGASPTGGTATGGTSSGGTTGSGGGGTSGGYSGGGGNVNQNIELY